MFLRNNGKFVLKAMGIAMLLASGFSWWQTRIEMHLFGREFWRNFLVMEAIFAVLICLVTATLLLAHCIDQELQELSRIKVI